MGIFSFTGKHFNYLYIKNGGRYQNLGQKKKVIISRIISKGIDPISEAQSILNKFQEKI